VDFLNEYSKNPDYRGCCESLVRWQFARETQRGLTPPPFLALMSGAAGTQPVPSLVLSGKDFPVKRLFAVGPSRVLFHYPFHYFSSNLYQSSWQFAALRA
jgi:hypothetical protein